jgi:glucose/arabinose dehydrogenase
MRLTIISLLICILLSSCYGIRSSSGGGKNTREAKRTISTDDIALPPGYQIQAIATDLTFPTDLAFDENGTAYVIESGYSYGEVWTEPKLIKLDNGKKEVVAKGGKNGPWNGMTFHDGYFYIAEGGELEGGKILRVDKNGEIKTLVEGLPSLGDHHTNGPVIIKDHIYFGQGTATNSGIVGEDNADFGWLKRHPEFHDIPCEDVVLAGKNFKSPNILTDDKGDVATTGAFVPFNTATTEGQVIKGSVPCSGAILKLPVNGGKPELVAWGLRNPFGLAVYNGELFVTENGYDDRGSRPVWGTGDVLWKIKENGWYGWPDHSAAMPLTLDGFKAPGKAKPESLLRAKPAEPPTPVAVLGVHSSSNGFDFSTSSSFGYEGNAFVAQFGDMAPNVGKVSAPVGFKVVVVDPKSGTINDFAVNKGKKNGPASWLKKGGLERPNSAKFNRDKSALYVVDFGVVSINNKKTISRPATGVVWKITKR